MKHLILTYSLLILYTLGWSQIKIDTNFEGANAQVFRTNTRKNEILFRPQLKHNQTTRCWFYFKIWDFDKTRSLKITEFNDQRELIPTYATYSYDNTHWHKVKGKKITQHIFSYLLPTRSHDTIYFATGYPYTYTHLKKYIASIASNPYLDTATLTLSEHNLPVPLLVITDTTVKQDKDLVWITTRQHAFESPANYCTEGIINFFLSNDSLARAFRRSAIVYIVPMVDVDNVYNGASGRMQYPQDFNRDWCDKPTWNAVREITRLMQATAEIYDYRIFMDIHAAFPGTESPIFAYFNLYDKTSPQYKNLRNFWLIFENFSPILPTEVSDYTQENYADRYVATHYNYVDFATTIECDWNNTDNGQQWTPRLWRETGWHIAQTIAFYLVKPKAK